MAREEADLRRAMKDEGLDLDFFVHRSRSRDEILPWGHIDNGMKPELLQSQFQEAMKSKADVSSLIVA
jgi:hypothetical protein